MEVRLLQSMIVVTILLHRHFNDKAVQRAEGKGCPKPRAHVFVLGSQISH